MVEQALRGFWKFLNTDIRDIPWGEVAEKGIEAVAATTEFSKAFKEQAPKIASIQSFAKGVEPFLEALESPIAELAVSSLPIVSLGIGLLKIYLGINKKELTLEESVVIAFQLAYLQSLESVLSSVQQSDTEKLNQIPVARLIEKQLGKLDETSLTRNEKNKIKISNFPSTDLCKQLDKALEEQLHETELENSKIQSLVRRVAWGTHRHIYQVVAEAGDELQLFADFLNTGGQQVQDKCSSIDEYLEQTINLLPNEKIFDENDPPITLQDLYVQLEVQPLTPDGKFDENSKPKNIHDWVKTTLKPQQPKKVIFIQGEAGRGKSAFCKMFAYWVQEEIYPEFIPILVRLQKVQDLGGSFKQTLEIFLEGLDFVQSDSGWLTDKNTQFLFLLDGFDELLLKDYERAGKLLG